MSTLQRRGLSRELCLRMLLPMGALALLVHGLILTPIWFPLRAVAGLIWAAVVPGALATQLLLADDQAVGIAERTLLAVGLGYVSLVLGTLALQFVPGPLTRAGLLTFYDLLVLTLLVLVIRDTAPMQRTSWGRIHLPPFIPMCRGSQAKEPRGQAPDHSSDPSRPRGLVRGVAVVLLVAALFRLPSLGYAEFQGDEATVLLKAAAVIQGIEDVLFLHKKGPAEIMIATFVYSMAGRLNEPLARLPFALASLSGLLVLLVVGHRIFDWHTGWWAATLIALNGYFVAFARIVQYQSLVFLMSCLVMLCIHRLWRGGRSQAFLILTALFTATGLLAHYDMAFVLPPVGYVLLRRWLEHPSERRQILRRGGVAALVLLIMLGLFCVPFVLHPHFRKTVDYISARVGGHPPYANFRHFFVSSTVYNSIYYIGFMVLLLVGAAFWHLSRVAGERRWLQWALIALFGVGTLSLIFRPMWWCLEPAPRNWSGVLFASLLLVLFSSKANGVLWKATLLWFAGPFLLYTFLLSDPRTHLYAMFPAWALLGSQGLTRIHDYLKNAALHWLARGILAGILLLSGFYVYWMFVQHMVEAERTYPEHRLPIYWTPYGNRFPRVGLFGFPYRAGWKVIGELYADGTLKGDYSSNEEPQITRWYTRGAFRCDAAPRYYFIAEHVQDAWPVPERKILEEYQFLGVVRAGRQPKIRIYERRPASLSYVDYHLEEMSTHYDNRLTMPSFDTALEDTPLSIQHPSSLVLGESIEFLGYELTAQTVAVGDPFYLTLYWRARQPVVQDYKVFTHLEKGGRIWAQKDSHPRCGREPTGTWDPGKIIVDQHCLAVDPRTPPGEYPLRIGMYLLQTGQRLHVFTPNGTGIGDTIELEWVSIVEG